MGALTTSEASVIERAAAEPMLDQVLAWSAVNSGSRNLAGLARDGGLAGRRLRARFPGAVELVDAAPVEAVDAAGSTLRNRPRPAPAADGAAGRAGATAVHRPHGHGVRRRSRLPGRRSWLEDGVLNGPGVADMKGGIAVMLAALKAVEASDAAATHRLRSDHQQRRGGRLARARRRCFAEAAQGKLAALTYEPSALPDGTLAGARPGQRQFLLRRPRPLRPCRPQPGGRPQRPGRRGRPGAAAGAFEDARPVDQSRADRRRRRRTTSCPTSPCCASTCARGPATTRRSRRG